MYIYIYIVGAVKGDVFGFLFFWVVVAVILEGSEKVVIVEGNLVMVFALLTIFATGQNFACSDNLSQKSTSSELPRYSRGRNFYGISPKKWKMKKITLEIWWSYIKSFVQSNLKTNKNF